MGKIDKFRDEVVDTYLNGKPRTVCIWNCDIIIGYYIAERNTVATQRAQFKLIISMIITAITSGYCFHKIKEGYLIIPFELHYLPIEYPMSVFDSAQNIFLIKVPGLNLLKEKF